MKIMNYTRLASITGTSLVESMKDSKSGCIIIDCRSFVAFNDAHIKTAINICCPSLIKRRLRKQNASLETLISCQTTLKRLRDGDVRSIVLYEEGSENGERTQTDEQASMQSSLPIVAKLLAHELRKKIYTLKGGFHEFKLKYAAMCELPQRQRVKPPRGPASLHLDFNKRSSRRSADENADDKTAPVEILPFLFLGNESHCACKEVLEKLGVTAVMNVSKTINNHFQDHFIYKNVPVDDTYNADISRWFRVAVDFIDSVEMSGGKVLIHCQAGISRSATICLAYLMSKRKYSLEQAYEYVKERRSVISPNFNFMGQLLNWEREVHAVVSPDKLSPAQSPCGLFNYSTLSGNSDSRASSLHSKNCFVTVQTPT